jgi:putative ABC transport system substrate-binding protein
VRRANDDLAQLTGLASELVSLAPDVIVSLSDSATLALQRATPSIPIVMATSNDPIGKGFVKSLAKPSGNITGLSNQGVDFTAKTFELLHVAFPTAKRIAVLTLANPSQEGLVQKAYLAAGTLGLTIIRVTARTLDDLGDAFAKMHSESCDALFVVGDARINIDRRIIELANEWRLPAIYQVSDRVDMGGLLSYGPDFHEEWRQAAVYVDRILKGANPADLPVVYGSPATRAARQTTSTIPIVMIAVGDPVRARFVTNLARPGGNVTGTTNVGPELVGKRIEILKGCLPGLARVAFLWNPDNDSNLVCEQRAQCRLCSAASPIRSAAASSTAWRDRAATQLALLHLSMH